jgi:Rod binding domain-containing protein
MSTVVSLGDAAGTLEQPPAMRPPQNVAEAAKQFEALMIAQFLKEAHSDGEGWLGGEEDTGNATATGLAEEQFAQALAQSGGLGLSAQITASLSAHGKK